MGLHQVAIDMQIIHFHPDMRMAVQFVAPLMEAERSAGYQTELVTSNRISRQQSVNIRFDLSFSNLLGLPFALWLVWRCVSRLRPDVVFSHNTKSSLLPLLGAWLAGVPVRVYFNHGVPYVGYRGILRCVLRALERWNCALASDVVTVSHDMKVLLQDVNNSIHPQIIQSGSACGIDLKVFSFGDKERENWRHSLGIKKDDLVAAYIGRPERRKGFELVLRLWAEHFHEKHMKLVLCGPKMDDVLRYLPNIPSNVLTLGFVNNVPEVLSGSDLMILPSMHEGLPYACLEAQAAGATVIANDVCGVRSLIDHRINGFLVPNNDLQKYVEIIRVIDGDRASVEIVRKHAKESVRRFSREIFVPSYISFLKGLLKKKS